MALGREQIKVEPPGKGEGVEADWPWPGVAFLAVLMVMAFWLLASPNGDPDTWWHLAAGRWMVAHRAVPHSDPFSWTRAGWPWVAHEWLTELVFYLAYLGVGSGGLALLGSLLVAATGWIIYRAAARRAGNQVMPAFLTFAVLLQGRPFLALRPQLFSYFFFALVLSALEDYRLGRRDNLYSLIPLAVIWANMHASFPLMGLLMVIYGLEGTVPHLDGGGWPRSRLHHLGAVLGLVVLAWTVNPNGYRLLGYPLETLGSDLMKNNINEWLSPDFHQLSFARAGLLLLAAPLAATAGRCWPWAGDWVLYLFFAFSFLVAVRNLPYLLLVLVLLLTASLPTRMRPAAWQRWVAIAALVELVVFVVVLWPREGAGRLRPAPGYPEKAVAYWQEHPPAGPVFNIYHWGGYLIWALPQVPVFIDGRADIYLEKILPDYLHITHLEPETDRLLQQYGIKEALLPAGHPLATAMALWPAWKQVYRDEVAVIYRRVD